MAKRTYRLTPDQTDAFYARLVRGRDLPEWAAHAVDCWLVLSPHGDIISELSQAGTTQVAGTPYSPRRLLAVTEGLLTPEEAVDKGTVTRAACNLDVWPIGTVYNLDQYHDECRAPVACQRGVCVNPHHADIRTREAIVRARDGDPNILYRVLVDEHRAMHHETLQLARRCAYRYPGAVIETTSVEWRRL